MVSYDFVRMETEFVSLSDIGIVPILSPGTGIQGFLERTAKRVESGSDRTPVRLGQIQPTARSGRPHCLATAVLEQA